MTTPSTCGVCKQPAYRDKSGRMMLHTRTEYTGDFAIQRRAVVCEGSDKGARP